MLLGEIKKKDTSIYIHHKRRHLYSVMLLLLMVLTLVVGCRNDVPKTNAAYYWSTEFSLDDEKIAFMQKHNIRKLYVRYFDVVVDVDGRPVPNATLRVCSSVPNGVRVVPVVYIVNDCMRGKNNGLAEKILKRILQMSETNDIGKVEEIQIDCDWTPSTHDAYFNFLNELRSLAREKGIILSATIRLHQLSETPPPVDKGVLMMYNTGDFTQLTCSKPILDVKDALPYLRGLKDYPLPLSAAYPIFGWNILFRGGKYVGIMHADDDLPVLSDDSIVQRQPELEDILAARSAVGKRSAKANDEMILFDLNQKNIKRFKPIEYEKIFNR